MAKKKTTRVAKSSTKTRAATRRKRGANAAPRASKMAAPELTTAAGRKSAIVFRQVESLLKAHGLHARLDTLRLQPSASAAPGECPDGMVKRVICRRGPDGRIVCQEECVPI